MFLHAPMLWLAVETTEDIGGATCQLQCVDYNCFGGIYR